MKDHFPPANTYEEFLPIRQTDAFTRAVKDFKYKTEHRECHTDPPSTQVTLTHEETGLNERGFFPVKAPMDGGIALDWLVYRLAIRVKVEAT